MLCVKRDKRQLNDSPNLGKYQPLKYATMSELVYDADLKSVAETSVWVQVPLVALLHISSSMAYVIRFLLQCVRIRIATAEEISGQISSAHGK